MKFLFRSIIMALLGTGASLQASAQLQQSYHATTTLNSTYTPLSKPILISDSYDQNLFLNLDLGLQWHFADMDFNYNGQGENGMLMFGAGSVAGDAASDSLDLDFDGFFIGIQSRSNPSNPSTISYQIDGAAPNRILKIEWKNAGLAMGDTADFVNFQMWMYESNSNCEIHFGNSYIKDPNTAFGPGIHGPRVGIFLASTKKKTYGTIQKSWYLYGDPAAPKQSNTDFSVALSSMPKSGTVYTFNYHSPAAIENTISPLAIQAVYPNPARDMVYITTSNTSQAHITITLTDITGKQITRLCEGEAGIHQTFTCNVAALPRGIYLLNVQSNEGTRSEKLILR